MGVGIGVRCWLALALLAVVFTPINGDSEIYFEKQRYDGWYNNRAYPDWGSVGSRLTRKSPASYADGVYMMAGADRPGARALSKLFMKGPDGLPSLANRTALLAFFGQIVTGEIVMASESGCPIEHHRIPVDKCDHMYDAECEGAKYMPFLRAAYDRNTGQSPNSPREQINQMTSWIDGSFVYSTSEAWVNAMRSFQNGSLASDGGMPLKNTRRVPLFNNPVPHYMRMLSHERLFLLGDPRTNQNPAMVTFGVLLMRWHNVVAARVHRQHPDWSDEQLFQRSRRIVIASLQNIIMYEYVPAFLGVPIPPYEGYKAEVAPGVTHEFAVAAFRFGHTLVPPAILLRDRNCRYARAPGGHDAIRLCQTWWDGNDVVSQVPIEEILMGMASQLSEREDALLCSDVRDNLFGPMEFSRRDLGALNIMRGRDNGLPDYNTAREYFGLPKVKTFNEINPPLFENNPDLLQKLIQVYDGRLDNIDVYIGGMLESTGHPGELFRAIIIDQFTRIRDADRFWFENEKNGIFTPEEIENLRHITMWDIIVNSTAVGPRDIQRDVFHWSTNDPCPQPYQLNASKLPPCKYLKGYDYFEGNEFAYIYTCLILAFVPILCAGAGYGVVKLQNSRRRRLKIQQEHLKNAQYKGSVDKMVCREWVHASLKRLVKLRLGPEPALHVMDRKGDKLRTIPLDHIEQLTVLESQEGRTNKRPLVLIRAAREHDLVLEMDSAASRRKFLVKLDTFLAQHKKGLNLTQGHRDQILATAETRERRQRKLEHFFREAYAITFGLAPGEKRRRSEDADPESIVMRTSLSKSEFASALGMKADAVFVKKMFNIVDKDGDGRISFQEFLDTVVLFSRGATDDKLRIIFDMCDNDRNGVIDKGELSEMLRSLVEIARTTSLRDEHVTELINGMFSDAGLQHKDHLTYSDFKVMMKEYKGEFVAIGLDCKGAKQNFLDTSTNVARMTSFHIEPSMESSRHWLLLKWDYLTTFLEENRQNIFYLFVFYVVTIGLFVERFAHYSFMSEHLDLRHIMGVGIAITRGSAASLSFCYSLLLLTMSRNLLTKLKEFSIQQYIPLDSSIQFHKIVACTALFFSLLHTAGHMVNFYHVSTQPVENLRCLTKEVHFTSDFRPGITYWVFQTVTGKVFIKRFILYSF